MNDFIEVYDDTISHELCGELIKWFDVCSDRGFTDHNMPFPGSRGKEITRRSDEQLAVISNLSIPMGLCNAFWETLYKCYGDYVANYDLENINLSCYNFKMHKVKEGQGYHVWHHENDGSGALCRRMLAWMTYLKVPEEGGETEFLYQSKRIEPEMGKTLIWPAHFTHLHRGNPPLKGEKYYITGWFERE